MKFDGLLIMHEHVIDMINIATKPSNRCE